MGAIAEAVVLYALERWNALQTPKNRARLILFLLCVASAVAVSQTAPAAPATATSSAVSPDQAISKIATMVSGKLSELRSNAKLVGFGTVVSVFFLILLMTWTTIKNMVGGKGIGELLGDWVPIFISFGVVMLFLDHNAAVAIETTMNVVAAAIAGNDMSNLESALRAGAEPLFKAVTAVIDQGRVSEYKSGGWMDSIEFLGRIAAAASSFIYALIAKAIALFCLLIAGVIMCCHLIMGFISVSLVLALAPVMVPFLMFRPLEFLFNSWLRFLLGACMLKIVVAFLLTVVAAMLTGMTDLATQFAKDAKNLDPSEALSVDVMLLGMVMVYALLTTLMMMQAPSIASGLLSGQGGHGFGGIRGLTQSVSGQGAHRAAIGTGQAAVGAAKGAAHVVRSGFAGKAARGDVKEGRPMNSNYSKSPTVNAAYRSSYAKAERAGAGSRSTGAAAPTKQTPTPPQTTSG